MQISIYSLKIGLLLFEKVMCQVYFFTPRSDKNMQATQFLTFARLQASDRMQPDKQ